jgi:hypothetical protein
MKTPPGERSPLDAYLPRPQVRERFETRVRAPAPLVLEVASGFDLQSLPVVHAIFRLRELLMRASSPPAREPRGLREEMLGLGWGLLEDRPDLLACGAACRPWEADVTFMPVARQDFAGFADPGRVKIAWTLEARALDPGTTLFVQETRAAGTDGEARARFARYWRWARFGIIAIRLLLLPAIRKAAERRWSSERSRP